MQSQTSILRVYIEKVSILCFFKTILPSNTNYCLYFNIILYKYPNS